VTVTLFDPKSRWLAEHFLADAPSVQYPEIHAVLVDSLARSIQTAVEEWFEDHTIAPDAPETA
jgi:hypothetical protein